MPYTLEHPSCHELLIKKSRFIACVQPVQDRQQAQSIVNRLRTEHPAAAHVCWALLAGGQSAAVDDGEPSGTAGRPMLEVLRHQQLEGVLATVVRYFGGVKLGAGGLVRAYTDSVAQALLLAQKVEQVARDRLELRLPYAMEDAVRRLLQRRKLAPLALNHGEQVEMLVEAPRPEIPAFLEELGELGRGLVQWARV